MVQYDIFSRFQWRKNAFGNEFYNKKSTKIRFFMEKQGNRKQICFFFKKKNGNSKFFRSFKKKIDFFGNFFFQIFKNFQEGREALPKAAYQYGVKNGEGGRKNKKQSAVSDAKRLDRELNEINKIMDKRKAGGDGAGGGGDYKKPKY